MCVKNVLLLRRWPYICSVFLGVPGICNNSDRVNSLFFSYGVGFDPIHIVALFCRFMGCLLFDSLYTVLT